MREYGNCRDCGSKLILEGVQVVGNSSYNILRCEKCKKQIIRSD